MGSQPHADTLFHLVPANQVAAEALHDPENKQFVSTSQKGHLGLEIGCHVPSTPRGHVIARLGRNADLILRASSPNHPMSAVHVAFELHPKTQLVLISVRSKRISFVKFRIFEEHKSDSPTDESSDSRTEEAEETITGDGVILYGQEYVLTIEQHEFHLVWRNFHHNIKRNIDALRELARRGCEQSLQRVQQLRSRDRPTDYDHSEALSWHVTRLKTTKNPKFRDAEDMRRKIGSGTFGTVFRSVDRASGHYFAIKVFDMNKCDPNVVEYARALLHREIKTMQALTHTHIIEYLGNQRFETPHPELFMPYRDGNLAMLALKPDNGPPGVRLPLDRELLCVIVLEQMLSALDYLASKGIIHRDVKPENILHYNDHDGNFVCQLADFGLANHHSLAKTKCGTPQFLAPELVPEATGIDKAQSPKIDVWSLCATIFALKSAFKGFPPRTQEYKVVLNTMLAMAAGLPNLEPMARKDPEQRAAASSMLVWLFDGRGLTTPRSRVPPIPPVPRPESNIGNRLPAANVVSNHARPVSRDRVHNTRQQAKRTTRARQRLITYPQEIQTGPENPQPALQPTQYGACGATRRRAEPRAARTSGQDNLAGPSRRRGREQEPRQAQRKPVYDYRMDLD